MRKSALPFFLLVIVALCSCGKQVEDSETEDAVKVVEAKTGPIQLDGAKAAEVLASDAAITVIDIRTPEEFAEGHLANAVNIDFTAGDFASKLSALDPEKPYLIHCASGNRSGKALPVFEKLQFNRLYHLNTGIKGWIADGQPVEK